MNAPIRQENPESAPHGGLRWRYVLLIVVVAMAATAGFTYWLLSHYLFLQEFTPVQLKPKEEQVLSAKLRSVGVAAEDPALEAAPLEPEPYSEAGASREIAFTERELNALLAKNTELARKVAIDLSGDLVSAKILIPLAQDFPMLGGKTLRVTAGVEMAYRECRPVVVLKGVSIMGVPVPNAWLGNLKNVDLAKEFGGDRGFWKTFADGVETIRVTDGRLLVQLKE